MKTVVNYYEKRFTFDYDEARKFINPWLLESFGCEDVTDVHMYIEGGMIKVDIKGCTGLE